MTSAQALATANDRLKRRSADWFWGGILAAAGIHFALLAFWPAIGTADYAVEATVLETVEIPDEYEIPPPPSDVRRPAVPLLSKDLSISEDITISEVTFPENPPSELPPPPAGTGVDVSERPTFTPYEVKPDWRDRAEFARLVERKYPPMLRDAGIGGTVVLWVFIDESGTVKSTRVVEGSGYEQLDAVAREVMTEARFTPALNRDQKVPVWIRIPVTFQSR